MQSPYMKNVAALAIARVVWVVSFGSCRCLVSAKHVIAYRRSSPPECRMQS